MWKIKKITFFKSHSFDTFSYSYRAVEKIIFSTQKKKSKIFFPIFFSRIFFNLFINFFSNLFEKKFKKKCWKFFFVVRNKIWQIFFFSKEKETWPIEDWTSAVFFYIIHNISVMPIERGWNFIFYYSLLRRKKNFNIFFPKFS